MAVAVKLAVLKGGNFNLMAVNKFPLTCAMLWRRVRGRLWGRRLTHLSKGIWEGWMYG